MNHQQTGRDLIVISDWMCARFVRLGWVQEMDRANQPQRRRSTWTRCSVHPPSTRAASTPCRGSRGSPASRTTTASWAARSGTSPTSGRATSRAGSPCSPASTRPSRCSCRATASTSPSGRRTTSTRSATRSRSTSANGQIRRFTGNDYTKDLVSGDVLACQAYSGDVIQLQADNPDIRFVVPEEGAELWSDSLMIPDRALPQGQRRAPRRLLLRPRGRRGTRRLGQLRLPGPRRPGRPRLLQGRGHRRPRREPPDLPGRGDAQAAGDRPGHHVEGARGVREAVERDRGVVILAERGNEEVRAASEVSGRCRPCSPRRGVRRRPG